MRRLVAIYALAYVVYLYSGVLAGALRGLAG